VFYLLAFPFLQGLVWLLGRNIRSSVEPISCTDVGQGAPVHSNKFIESAWTCAVGSGAVPMPQSSTSGHTHHAGPSGAGSTTSVEGVSPGTPVNLDSVVALAQAKGATGFSVSFQKIKLACIPYQHFPTIPLRK